MSYCFADQGQFTCKCPLFPLPVRLSDDDGVREEDGTVEVYLPYTGWAEVCDDSSLDLAAFVACKQLGFVTGQRSTSGSTQQTLHGQHVAFQCTGSEDRLSQCGNSVQQSAWCRSANIECCKDEVC